MIHCSDSCDSLDLGAREIRQWHLERGWSDIGYHFVVRKNGTIELGRPIGKVGAHVKGHNKRSIGICWVGRKTITHKQYSVLTELAAALMKEFKLPFDQIQGHYELDDLKTCPNLDMNRVRGDVLFVNNITEGILNVVKRSKEQSEVRKPNPDESEFSSDSDL